MINIETKRLLIRNLKREDAAALHPFRESLFVRQYNAMRPYTFEEYQAEVDKSMENDHDLVIELKDFNMPIGVIDWGRDHLRYEANAVVISYWLGQEYAQNGYMSEALRAFIDYLFTRDDVDVIVARVFTPNIPSLNLAKKIGFTQEGVLRHAVKGYGDTIFDDTLFSILKSEWKEKR